MTQDLIVTSGDEELFHLRRAADGLTILAVASDLRPLIEDLRRHGLDELLPKGEHRHTDATDENFLPRLSDYLTRQFNFTTTLMSF